MATPAWTWIAASERGTAHARCSELRQDAFRVVTRRNRWLIATVCDGAGSASHGRQGALLAARVLSSMAASFVATNDALPDADTAMGWLETARAEIEAAAALRETPVSTFATTVVMAVTDGSDTLTVHIGDGAIVAREKESLAWASLSWPEQGEYASTTFFVTDERLSSRIARHSLALDRLVIMSDGLERLALDFANEVPHAGFFEGICKGVADADRPGLDHDFSCKFQRYLGSDAITARTDDDKTLIAAVLR